MKVYNNPQTHTIDLCALDEMCQKFLSGTANLSYRGEGYGDEAL